MGKVLVPDCVRRCEVVEGKGAAFARVQAVPSEPVAPATQVHWISADADEEAVELKAGHAVQLPLPTPSLYWPMLQPGDMSPCTRP